MSAAKRVVKELEELQEALPPYLWGLTYDPANALEWNMLLLPERPPYNLKAFRLCVSFPQDYPLMPPQLTFRTPIYHPDVDHNSGHVCLPTTSPGNWTPNTRMRQVLDALNMLVNHPELAQPLQLALAEELVQDPEQFYRKAERHTLDFGLQRPS